LFGEWAMDDRLNGSGVMGLVSVIDRRVDVAAHFRWIGRGFQSVDGQAFQRSSSGKPERGIYVQCRFRPAERHTLDIFGDLHQIPEPTAQLSVPTYGVVRGFRWLYQADKRTSLHLRIQTVVSEGMDRDMRMPAIRSIHQTSIRLHGNFAVDEKRSLSLRLEKTVYVEQGGRPQDGFLSYLEWSRSFSSGAGADFRLMWVSTDGWDARIYAYEQDVLYKVGFPAFHGQRIRSYLNLSIPVGPKTRIWAKGFLEKNIENQFVASGMDSGRSGLTLQVRHQW